MAKAVRKKIKVILQNSLRKVGTRGDIKEVSKGFFNNFLAPKGYASKYTPDLEKKITSTLQMSKQEHDKNLIEAQDVKKKLANTIISFIMNASGTGVLYGSVDKKTILKILKDKVNYNYKDLEIAVNIKKTGLWYVIVDIFEDINIKIPVLVEKTEDDLKILEHKFKKGELND